MNRSPLPASTAPSLTCSTEPARWQAAIEAQLLDALGRSGAEVLEAGGFRVHLWHRADPFYRNVAVPVARPGDWPSAIHRMAGVFRTAGRPARLEFIEERWPDLVAALGDAGFVRRQRMPVMVLDRPGRGTPAREVELLGPDSPPGAVAAALEALNGVFGQAMEEATLAAETAQLVAELEAGNCRVAVVRRTGQPVAGACLIGAGGTAAELAGVWTAAGHRRQGLGTAVCRALLDAFLTSGGRFAWLGAHDDAAHGLYARLGFRPVGHQLDFSGPAA